MELIKTIELKCGQTYLLKLEDGNVLEVGDVFMSREKGYGTRPYHFSDFENQTLLRNDILEANPQLVVVKSISKSYGVPGLRLGVLATADEKLLGDIKADLPIWNINSFAEYYMQIFGKYEKTYAKACKFFNAERKRFFEDLQKINFLKVYPSQANYFLCEVTSTYTSAQLTQILLDNNILIKDCSTKAAFNGKNYVRIAVRGTEDNQKLIESLQHLQ